MPAIVRRINLEVDAGGSSVPNVLSARVRFDFNQRVSQASFVTQVPPGGASYDDDVVIRMGVVGGGNENTQRFRGVIRSFNITGPPTRVETVCYGYLQRAVEYQNWEDSHSVPVGGLIPLDLTGRQPDTAANIVQAVLDRCNIPGGLYSGHIGSTPTLYGVIMDPFVWRNGRNDTIYNLLESGETAISYIERYDEIDAHLASSSSGGRYRTFETLGGDIYRFEVGGRPRGASVTFGRGNTFTQGQDILEGSFQRTLIDFKNYIVVTGYDVGGGAGPFFFPAPGDPGYGGGGRKTYQFNSPMIEKSHDGDTLPDGSTEGMSCETVAGVLNLDYNREKVTGTLVTFLDDPIGLAQTHTVNAPNMLGTSEPLWVQSLEISVDENGFRQRIGYLGGGSPDSGLPDPPG